VPATHPTPGHTPHPTTFPPHTAHTCPGSHSSGFPLPHSWTAGFTGPSVLPPPVQHDICPPTPHPHYTPSPTALPPPPHCFPTPLPSPTHHTAPYTTHAHPLPPLHATHTHAPRACPHPFCCSDCHTLRGTPALTALRLATSLHPLHTFPRSRCLLRRLRTCLRTRAPSTTTPRTSAANDTACAATCCATPAHYGALPAYNLRIAALRRACYAGHTAYSAVPLPLYVHSFCNLYRANIFQHGVWRSILAVRGCAAFGHPLLAGLTRARSFRCTRVTCFRDASYHSAFSSANEYKDLTFSIPGSAGAKPPLHNLAFSYGSRGHCSGTRLSPHGHVGKPFYLPPSWMPGQLDTTSTLSHCA